MGSGCDNVILLSGWVMPLLRMITEGEGGKKIPNIYYVIFERPLTNELQYNILYTKNWFIRFTYIANVLKIVLS